jgi:MoaA/NifB/PqqE/SkfB family radical SAM enzyme
MGDRRALFGIAGRVELATQRCDLRCDWCGHCRERDFPAGELRRLWAEVPSASAPVLWLRGGDPFRYADLSGWTAWARRAPETAVGIEGPAIALAAADREAIAARIVAARPDAVAVALPTADIERTAMLTGARWDPRLALETLAALGAAGMAVGIVFPVHPSTADELGGVIRAVRERLGVVDVILRRSPSVRSVSQPQWSELDDLSRALAALPADAAGPLLRFDAELGYPACVLAPNARRRDLFPVNAVGEAARPLGAVCEPCAWATRCTFRAGASLPPADRVHPLGEAESTALDPRQPRPMGAAPRRFHTDRASLGLPEFLCFAPWTALTVCEPRRHPVPCALSWVDSEMTPEEIAPEMGTTADAERERESVTLRDIGAPWHVVDNERLSLMDLWNSPLLRRMRREMTGGEKSSRCRTMCRVVMGVEERGVANFQRPESDFTPEILANRRLLLEEIQAGKSVLTASPLDLVIGVAAHCNISCGFCDGPLGRYGDLSDRRRDEIIAWLPTLMSFGASGPGEPLMNKNFLFLLQHISEVGYPSLIVSLTTNGTLLTPELLQRTSNVPWGSVRISLNAGSSDTWERMTGKRHFDRIMANLDALCALRERRPRPFTITLSMVLGSVQIGDLAKFARIVHDHRTAIVVEPMYDNLRNLSPWIRADRLPGLAEELKDVADDYIEKNPDISRAFRAVEQFARARIAAGDYSVLKGH